ncbi:TfoX/Sxy family DNA transformation protein [Enterovibrio norvegicus]|uniref:DNA transformation protein n=1 Tax=Enterovibrio norvegicus TaxID=188144 RepID=A0A2N7LCV1_9GAMM|nr:TfoX/Sxy family DNA transformation protein [Enterovibrio norvegicus]PMN65428.1 DNA transformation protein [Enterovibrio norvegicus]PMN93165.1 DNA transformation protein [Enterovibrio norvegicus]
MDKPTLKNTLKFFECLGTIKSRSMFGGFGVFCDQTMFALVVNDRLHLRAGQQNEREFKRLSMQPYIYKKRGFPVVTKYYSVPDDWWEQTDTMMDFAKQALAIARDDQEEKKTATPNRIKDLPNLRLATERMLKKAGIDSVEQLQQEGAVRAYQALQKSHSDALSLELLWALEGAIEGKHWSVITPQRRDELLNTLQQ